MLNLNVAMECKPLPRLLQTPRLRRCKFKAAKSILKPDATSGTPWVERRRQRIILRQNRCVHHRLGYLRQNVNLYAALAFPLLHPGGLIERFDQYASWEEDTGM